MGHFPKFFPGIILEDSHCWLLYLCRSLFLYCYWIGQLGLPQWYTAELGGLNRHFLMVPEAGSPRRTCGQVGLSQVLSPRLVDNRPPLESPHDLSSVSLCVSKFPLLTRTPVDHP